jgi:hypothetical protein
MESLTWHKTSVSNLARLQLSLRFSRARLRHAGPPGRLGDRALETRSAGHEYVKYGGMTTRARGSAGLRGPVRARGVGVSRALSRGALPGAAADAGRLPPLPAGR